MEDKVDQDIYSTLTDFEDKPLPQSEEEEEEDNQAEEEEEEEEEEEKQESTLLSHEKAEQQQELTHSRLHLVVLGIFCALAIPTSVFTGMKSTALQQSFDDLITDTQNLMERRMTLKKDIEHLLEERETGCDSCPADWILHKSECYLFYDQPPRWKTWEESRRICQLRRSDLVVIDDLEEQKFVSKYIKYYYDELHGYWIGLQEINKTWTWVDGHVDTLGFWMKPMDPAVGPKGMVIPKRNPSESWKKSDNGFLNKFICERDVRKP